MNDFDIVLRDEEVTAMAHWLTEGGYPTGIAMFDKAWRLVREDRPDRPAWNCPTSRLLIHRFFERIQELYAEAA